MADFDDFASLLLEEAKRFLEKAEGESDGVGRTAYLHAALNLAFCSLEAHTNSVAVELASHAEFSSPHDQGVLLEQDVRLENGAFKTKGLKIFRFEDRYLFITRRVSGKALNKSVAWWAALSGAADLRNKLTHPKEPAEITLQSVRSAIQAIIEAVNALYLAVYKTGLPAAGMKLHSRLSF